MKRIGINRRTLLATMATMATLPVLPSLRAESAKRTRAQGADSGKGGTLPGSGQALEPGERSVWVTRDLVADFGGDLNAWNKYYTTQSGPVLLTIPAGNFGSDFPDMANPGTFSPRTCIIQGAGRDLTFVKIRSIGAGSTPDRGGRWPRLRTCHKGDTHVTVIAPDRTIRKLRPGRWHVIFGLDMMGYGYPQNNAFYEYNKIVSYNPDTGVIELELPLINDYKDTWPLWWWGGNVDFGGGGGVDAGGSPTIIELGGRWYLADVTPQGKHFGGWDQDLTIRELTINNAASGEWWYGTCRQLTFENCNFPGFTTTPSVSKRWVHKGCSLSGTMIEVDKMVEYLEFDNCYVRRIGIQSQSPKTLVIKNSTIDALGGQGVDTLIDTCTIGNMRLGINAYGMAPKTLEIKNSTIGAGGPFGFGPNTSIATPNRYLGNVRSTLGTVAENNYAGIFRVPLNPLNQIGLWWIVGVPGGWYKLRPAGPVFQIIDVWKDSTYCYFRTNLTGERAWATVAAGHIGDIIPHFCPFLKVTNSGGHPFMTGMSHLGVQAPAFSYYYEEFTGPQLSSKGWPMFGRFVEANFNVIKPYTGARSRLMQRLWSTSASILMYPDWNAPPNYGWNAHFDLKIAGLRHITATTATGLAPNDSLAGGRPPGAGQWLDAGMNAWNDNLRYDAQFRQILSEDESTWPHFTVEVILDQEFY